MLKIDRNFEHVELKCANSSRNLEKRMEILKTQYYIRNNKITTQITKQTE